MKNPIYIGNTKLNTEDKKVSGSQIDIAGENYYKISNVDTMRPFFMSIVSDSNHWMFISSNGGLSAGRKDCDSALFPYYTDDKITESAEVTGSKTIIKVHKEDRTFLWEPFSDAYKGLYATKRNLYKNDLGNKVIFEEINHDLEITYRYEWNSSNRFGFIKKSTLINNGQKRCSLTLLDGLQNIMPYGVNADLQNSRSNLVDAYKKSELEPPLGIYALSAIIVDKAEPSEALKATIAWAIGLETSNHLLSSRQLESFRRGLPLREEIDIRAEKCAYFISSELTLEPRNEKKWMIVANVNQGPSDVKRLMTSLNSNGDLLSNEVLEDVALGSKNLIALAAAADGLQLTADKLRNSRHFSNVLFNIMRGGIFDYNYEIQKKDFSRYIEKANKNVFENKIESLNSLPEIFTLGVLRELGKEDNDNHFKRLCFEYMPLKFSRRHGDPSRPWNKFSINTRNEFDGSQILDYEGNWRDIFQNWEALAFSYPEFIENMIHKFLNATTFDGYNPYRVTKDGFDWEVIEPNDPWSYIGYWGDHQIIYLLKFLEFIEGHYPSKLENFFNKDLFVYANVPYKIKSYEDILLNPKDTIVFDHDLELKIREKRKELGADGALLENRNNVIQNVNLIEKLLATVLAKVSNFIPEAGLWLNTQRPEWNDANNALVGNGVSVVTLCYLRRFLNFFEGIVSRMSLDNVEVSEELADFFIEVVVTLNQNHELLKGNFSDTDRKVVMDGLGGAASIFRTNIYEKGFSGSKRSISKDELQHFLKITLAYTDHSIAANKRNDDLYHAYNLISIDNNDSVSISYLSEMLEGQVAVLSSGYLSLKESLKVLDGMKKSALFREDQYSYLLYPNKELSRYIDKNNIPLSAVENSTLLKRLVADRDTRIIEKDVDGNYHFNGNFNNANSLKKALSDLVEGPYAGLVEKEKEQLLAIFEKVFDHKSFTGRSGTFFGYEGLGSIYWHMVSKLLLAVKECCLKAIANNEDESLIGGLLDHYYEIDAGIGVHKSPELYGAFPTDPYSHTPANKGAQQPGMTGQVKEDILSRIGELGVVVSDGKIAFGPGLLKKEEFLTVAQTFDYVDVFQNEKQLILKEGTLGFTYCQVPIIYIASETNALEIVYSDNTNSTSDSLILNKKNSSKVFGRTGKIDRIIVSLDVSQLH